MNIQQVGSIRQFAFVLNDEEIEDIREVINEHRGALPEHAERFLNELNNR